MRASIALETICLSIIFDLFTENTCGEITLNREPVKGNNYGEKYDKANNYTTDEDVINQQDGKVTTIKEGKVKTKGNLKGKVNESETPKINVKENVKDLGEMAIFCTGNLETTKGQLLWDHELNNAFSKKYKLLSQLFISNLPGNIISITLQKAYSRTTVVRFAPRRWKIKVFFRMFFKREELKNVEQDLFNDPINQFQSHLESRLTMKQTYYVTSLKVLDAVTIDAHKLREITFEGKVYEDGKPLKWNKIFRDKQSKKYNEIVELVESRLKHQLRKTYPLTDSLVKIHSIFRHTFARSRRFSVHAKCIVQFSYAQLEHFYPHLLSKHGIRGMQDLLNAIRSPNGIHEYRLIERNYAEDRENIIFTSSSTLVDYEKNVPWNESKYRELMQSDIDVVKSCLFQGLSYSGIKPFIKAISDIKFNNNGGTVVVYTTMEVDTAALFSEHEIENVDMREAVSDEIAAYLSCAYGIRGFKLV